MSRSSSKISMKRVRKFAGFLDQEPHQILPLSQDFSHLDMCFPCFYTQDSLNTTWCAPCSNRKSGFGWFAGEDGAGCLDAVKPWETAGWSMLLPIYQAICAIRSVPCNPVRQSLVPCWKWEQGDSCHQESLAVMLPMGDMIVWLFCICSVTLVVSNHTGDHQSCPSLLGWLRKNLLMWCSGFKLSSQPWNRASRRTSTRSPNEWPPWQMLVIKIRPNLLMVTLGA